MQLVVRVFRSAAWRPCCRSFRRMHSYSDHFDPLVPRPASPVIACFSGRQRPNPRGTALACDCLRCLEEVRWDERSERFPPSTDPETAVASRQRESAMLWRYLLRLNAPTGAVNHSVMSDIIGSVVAVRQWPMEPDEVRADGVEAKRPSVRAACNEDAVKMARIVCGSDFGTMQLRTPDEEVDDVLWCCNRLRHLGVLHQELLGALRPHVTATVVGRHDLSGLDRRA